MIQKTRTMKEFIPLILTIPILHAVMPVTFACDSCRVTSYRKSKRTRKGPEMFAVDTANKTITPFSLQDCSLDCTRDLTCSGFNIKDSHTCGLYNYNPKITVLNSSCTYYQVAVLLIVLSFSCLLIGIWMLFLAFVHP